MRGRLAGEACHHAEGAADPSVYSASKAGLALAGARTFSAELVARGIRVNAISPGTMTTLFYSRMGRALVEDTRLSVGHGVVMNWLRVALHNNSRRTHEVV